MLPSVLLLLATVGGITIGAACALRKTCSVRDGLTMLLYVSLSVAIDLTIATTSQQHGGTDPYEKLSVVVFVEFTKFVASLLLLQARAEPLDTAIEPKHVAAIALPAGLYAANNWLLLATLEKIDVGVFAVVRETNLVFTAMLWVCVFGASLGPVRWSCVFAIVMASVLAQARSVNADFRSVGLALVLTSVNACATVANERVVKGPAKDLDLNQANVVLYALCGSLALSLAVFTHGVQFLWPQSMFHGFDAHVVGICCGQAFLGLVVSRLLKHTSAVAKGVLTVFRPLILLVAAPVFTSTQLNVSGAVAGVVAGIAALAYLKEGPVTAPAPEEQPVAAQEPGYGAAGRETRKPGQERGPWAVLAACGLLAALTLVGGSRLHAHHPALRKGVFTQLERPELPASCDPDLFTQDIELFCALKRSSTVHLDAPALAPKGQCALVSNSGEIKTHSNGADIDAHDTVIRVNDAPLGDAYAEFVGRSTTVRFIEGETEDFGKQQKFLAGLNTTGAPLLVVPLKGTRHGNQAAAEKLHLPGSGVRLAYLTEGYAPVMDGFRQFLRRSFPPFADPAAATTDPTTGAMAMLFALSSCDSVDAYSMQTPAQGAGTSYNYYSHGGSPGSNSWHGQLKAEHDLWTRVAATEPAEAQRTGKAVLPGFACVPCDGVADRSAVLSPVALMARLSSVAH